MSNAEKVLEPFQKIFAAMGISDSQIKLAAENFSLPKLNAAERKELSEGKEFDQKILEELMKNLAPLVPSRTRSTSSFFTSATNIFRGKDTRRKITTASTCAFVDTCATRKRKIVTNPDTS